MCYQSVCQARNLACTVYYCQNTGVQTNRINSRRGVRVMICLVDCYRNMQGMRCRSSVSTQFPSIFLVYLLVIDCQKFYVRCHVYNVSLCLHRRRVWIGRKWKRRLNKKTKQNVLGIKVAVEVSLSRRSPESSFIPLH